jgi:hypothetical protein
MRLLALFVLCVSLVSHAQATTTRTYSLIVPPSSFDVGCQGPCDCAIVSRPTYGSFDLVSTGFDGLYDTYRVERYIASFNNGPGAVALTGAGTFRIGGEVAYQQQMQLDLVGPGGERFHVDSGLVPVPVSFPKIEIACAAHGFACYDTVLNVGAVPVGTVDVSPGGSAIVRVVPNPFSRETTIQLALDPARPARVTVLDAAGRVVRTLTASATVRWDGKRDSGDRALPGIYWLRVDWPGGADTKRLIKLQ